MLSTGSSFLKYKHNGLLNSSIIAVSDVKSQTILYQSKDFLVFSSPTYQTIQVDQHIHVLDCVFANMNHSCDPNTFIDTHTLSLIAERDIKAEEELTFSYFTTEWRMDKPFKCECGSLDCVGEILGAYKLSPRWLSKYRLSNHVQKLIS